MRGDTPELSDAFHNYIFMHLTPGADPYDPASFVHFIIWKRFVLNTDGTRVDNLVMLNGQQHISYRFDAAAPPTFEITSGM